MKTVVFDAEDFSTHIRQRSPGTPEEWKQVPWSFGDYRWHRHLIPRSDSVGINLFKFIVC
jgi:hypothetical protein